MTVITLTINDRLISAQDQQSLLEIIREQGLKIPTLCHLDGLSERAGCRLCLVEVENNPKLQAACVMQPQEGMIVRTHTAKVNKYRQMITELLLSERNHVCAVCVMNGHCELQDQAATLAVDHVRYDYLHPEAKMDASHPLFTLDHNRCILCARCVRVCDEVEGAHTWDISGRGVHSWIVSDLNMPWGSSQSCTSCGKCVQVCPTGALSKKGMTVAEMKKQPDFLTRILGGREKNYGNGLERRQTMPNETTKMRLATAWLGGCSGCHMSFLDLDDKLLDLAEVADLVYSPIADTKLFPENVDVTLVEGAVANVDHLELAQQIRERSKLVVSFGDCAVTGNVTSLRNYLPLDHLLTQVYHEGPGRAPRGGEADKVMPALLPKVLPLHQVISVDAYMPGCPPDADRIWTAVSALIAGCPIEFDEARRKFG